MNNTLLSLIRNILKFTLLFATLIFTYVASAQTTNAQTKTAPTKAGTFYSVKPDYRKCAFPLCGGWHLTPVNQYSLQPETEEEAYDTLSLLPNSIYVPYLNFKALGLKKKQIEELQGFIHTQTVLLRGNIASTKTTSKNSAKVNTFNANGAWVSANNKDAIGPYQKITSTGIVCITTPCPYFKTQLLNNNYSAQIDDLNLEAAELTEAQQAAAWESLSTKGLIITGTTYNFTGFDETGAEPSVGTGVKATQVFFSYPAKR